MESHDAEIPPYNNYQKDGDGSVSWAEFEAGMRQELGEAWTAHEPTVRRLYTNVQSAYFCLDTNGDGVVDSHELLAGGKIAMVNV